MDALLHLKESLSDRYDIKREIGAGGMATVYLAQDLRHDRPVALKVLNPELGAVLGPERFLSEIRVTANLQHPNLLPLFDSGAVDGLLYYVMPFVEGETLRARLNREKQLPVDEAVRMTVAVANALDYAHSHGVIHRDLKPENILLQAGQPVIADFGIALAVSNAGGGRITQTGLSLGTPQYMSPEQATGDRVIDGRSDIYSLGAVAYEMLTGEPPHTGSTSQAIIARMLTEKPRPMRTSRPTIPEYVEFAVQHALEKLPADRFSTAREFSDAIQGRGATGTTTYYPSQQPAAVGWRSRLRDPLTVGLGALALIALAVAAFGLSGRNSSRLPPSPVSRFVLWTPDSLKPVSNFPWPGTISPDGGTVVFRPASSRILFAVRTNQLNARALPGTEDAGQVIFSPDGQWIGFESNGKFRKARLDGSTPIAVSNGNSFNGADWTVRDEIIFGSEGKAHGLSSVSANGGTLVEFAKTANEKTDYLWPIASPDGKTAVFTVWEGNLESAKLASASISDGKVRQLNLAGIRPLAIIDHTLVYLQADGLTMAVKLNRGFNGTDGPPVAVLDPVVVAQGLNGNSEIFVSSGGALVTSRGGTSSQLVWFSANGTTSPILNEVRRYGAPHLSPDGKRIVVTVSDTDGSDLWIYDLASRTFSRLTSTKTAGSPVWSIDGTKVFFIGLDQTNHFAIWSQSVDGGAVPEKISENIGPSLGLARVPDGRSLVYTGIRENAWGLTRVLLDSGGKKVPLAREGTNELGPALSPDGRWIALSSDQTGVGDVFVRSFPNPTVRLQISAAGGTEPAWSLDGKRVYYRSGNTMLAATIATSPTVRVVARDTVAADLRNITASPSTVGYDVGRDGRFLGRLSNRDDYQLVIVPNWRSELEARMAGPKR